MVETYPLCDEKLIDEIRISENPRNFFLTTQERKNSAKFGFEARLTIDSIYNESRPGMPKVWTVGHLNISEQNTPRDQDVERWSHLNGIEREDSFDVNFVRLER